MRSTFVTMSSLDTDGPQALEDRSSKDYNDNSKIDMILKKKEKKRQSNWKLVEWYKMYPNSSSVLSVYFLFLSTLHAYRECGRKPQDGPQEPPNRIAAQDSVCSLPQSGCVWLSSGQRFAVSNRPRNQFVRWAPCGRNKILPP